jgi:hypothetical protein
MRLHDNDQFLLGEIITIYSENHTIPRNTVCGQNAELLSGR